MRHTLFASGKIEQNIVPKAINPTLSSEQCFKHGFNQLRSTHKFFCSEGCKFVHYDRFVYSSIEVEVFDIMRPQCFPPVIGQFHEMLHFKSYAFHHGSKCFDERIFRSSLGTRTRGFRHGGTIDITTQWILTLNWIAIDYWVFVFQGTPAY